MTRMSLALCGVIAVASAVAAAQAAPPHLRGRWRLIERTAGATALDTLVITAPDELLITETPFTITVEHPSKPGTHPEARVFEYGSGGVVGGLPGGTAAIQRTWSV